MKGKRLLIDESALESLCSAVSEIKYSQEYSKINEGRLASEILNHFFRRYYLKDKNLLSKRFFNKRAFLKNLIQKTDSDEEILESFQKHLRVKKKKEQQ